MQSRAYRFALHCPIEFRFRGSRGQIVARGVTVNISSRGLLFETASAMSPGSRVEAVVALCPSDGHPPISILSVQGVAVRCDNGKVAVAVKKHRLRPVNPAPLSTAR